MRSAPLLVAVFVVVVSAVSVVYVRHQHRVVFIELQKVLATRDSLTSEWSQLLLEQSTWSFHHVVEKKARRRLEMTTPAADQIRIVAKP